MPREVCCLKSIACLCEQPFGHARVEKQSESTLIRVEVVSKSLGVQVALFRKTAEHTGV